MPPLSSRHDYFWVRVATIGVMVSLLAFLSSGREIDDALIYARYIANALHGLGLVFNQGESVNSLSSPLYSYLVLGTAKMLGGRVLAASALVSGVFLFVACMLAESLVAMSGLLLGATGYFYSMVGMETSTFLAMLLLIVVLVRSERYNFLPSAAMLLLLTRFEGGALLLPLTWELSRRRSWPTALSFVPAGLMATVYLLLNHAWYGALLPTSAAAKFGQGRSGLWGHWPFAFTNGMYQLKPDFLSTVYVVLFVAVLVIPGVLALRRSALNRVVLPFLGLLLVFYIGFNIPGYKWYFAPFICFAMVYACAPLPRLGQWRWAVVPVILFSAVTAGWRFWHLPAIDLRYDYPGISAWLMEHTPADARVEAAEIGTVGWLCQRCYVLDTLGLTLPKNAAHIANGDLRSWLSEDRPDYVVVHVAPWKFEDVAKDSSAYERVPVDFGPTVYILQRKGIR